MSYGVIYLVTNTINGKKYVGQTTKSLDYRFKGHCNTSNNAPLGCAIRKYGKENFTIELLEECETYDTLNLREQYHIQQQKSYVNEGGYNLTFGGEAGFRDLGPVVSEQISKTLGRYTDEDILYIQTMFLTGRYTYEDLHKITGLGRSIVRKSLNALDPKKIHEVRRGFTIFEKQPYYSEIVADLKNLPLTDVSLKYDLKYKFLADYCKLKNLFTSKGNKKYYEQNKDKVSQLRKTAGLNTRINKAVTQILTVDDVLKIKEILLANPKTNLIELAKTFSVHPNTLLSIKKGRTWAGIGPDLSLRSWLTDEDVLDIYHSIESGTVLAKRYGTTPTTVSNIRNGKTRSAVTGHER